MNISVTQSSNTLVPDTLPAVKVRYFSEDMPNGNVYTYARLYALNQQLMLSLCAFERAPADESKIAFCFAGQKTSATYGILLSPNLVEVVACNATATFASSFVSTSFKISPQRFSGEDEQGFYWGAELALPANLLAKADIDLQEDISFCAAVYKFDEGNPFFGASCKFLQNAPFTVNFMDTYTLVPY